MPRVPEAFSRWWVGLPLQGFWRPSVHHRSLGCFYRFVDPKVEAQYAQRCAAVWRAILRIYCVVVFVFAFQDFFGYLGTPQDPFFWTLFGVCATTLLSLGVSFVGWTLSYALPMHALSVCLLGALFVYHLRLITTGHEAIVVAYIFDGMDPSTVDPELRRRAEAVVRIFMGQLARREGLLNCCTLWFSLGIAGFHGWTLLAYGVLYLACVVGNCENPVVDEKGTAAFCFTVGTLGSLLVSVVIERVRRSDFLAQIQLARELQASQLADSVLNHMLKNALADVAANIEMFLAGELGPEVLEDAVVCLRRGIQSCQARTVYLKMVAGEYVPVLNVVDLKEFGQQLVAGRNVATDLVDCTVLMDSTLMHLILENALSNAFKHGHPDLGVELFIRMERLSDEVFSSVPHMVSFVVRNFAHPLRPTLTDELVQKLFRGVARLQPRAVLPTLSDGIGLLHCALAARLGNIALALRQEGDVVTFTATVEAQVRGGGDPGSPGDDGLSLVDQFPAGLKVLCLDDSSAARRLLEFHLRRGCPDATVRTYGATESDVHSFVTEALREADIVVLDQNLEYATPHYGTDLCRRLLAHGYRGLVCIRSSDDSPEDRARYAASGAHCSVGKDILGSKMVQQLKMAYVLNIGRPPLAGRHDPSSNPPGHGPPDPPPPHPPPALVWEN